MRRKYPSIRFVRFGIIKSFKQWVKDREKDFYYPPARKGLYAFPKGFVEYFLVATREPYDVSQKSVWLRDEKGVPFLAEENYEYEAYMHGEREIDGCKVSKEVAKLLKRKHYKRNWVDVDVSLETSFAKAIRESLEEETPLRLRYLKPPKQFNYCGVVWSHLHYFEGFPEELRKKNWINGSWIKLSYRNYCLAFHKVTKFLKEKSWKENHPDGSFDFQEYLCWNRKNWKERLNKDDLEVFIEKIKG